MFNWIRLKAKNAVLAGINDAAVYLDGHGTPEIDDAQKLLEERVRLLPAPISVTERQKARTARVG